MSTNDSVEADAEFLGRHGGSLELLLGTGGGLAWLVLRDDTVVLERGELAERLGVSTLVGRRIADLVGARSAGSLDAARHASAPSLLSVALSAGGAETLNARCAVRTQGNETVIVCCTDSIEASRFADEVVRVNNELAVLDREHLRQAKELAATLEDLRKSHWQLERISAVLPICLGCGRVKNADAAWEDVAKFLNRHASFLSHGYCPPCAEMAIQNARRQIEDERA